MNTALMLPLFLVLLILTAFFNLAEMALVAARTSALEYAENATAARKVLDLKKRPALFLAAIRAGDLITDLLTGAFIVSWIEGLIRTGMNALPVIGGYASAVAGLGAFVVVSYLMLVFTDLAPKSIALSAPERAAMLIASPLRLLIFVARPFLAVLEGSNTLVLRILRVKPQSEERVTQAAIRRVLSEGLGAGALLSFERSMMERVLDLDHRSVRTVMTGRRYIDLLATDMDEDRLREAVLGATASRLLLAEQDNLDKLVGIVSRADVLSDLTRGGNIDLSAIAVAPAYVSENASVLSVLETLKSVPVHMVIVVDELGSVVGLATLADVLEAVAGDVTRPKGSAMATEISHLTAQADGSYLVSGNKPVDDVAETLPLAAPIDRGYKTMAGLVIDRLRRIPNEGETIDLPTLTIEVISVQQGVVKTLKLVPKWRGRARRWRQHQSFKQGP
jgi:putative hemolysin